MLRVIRWEPSRSGLPAGGTAGSDSSPIRRTISLRSVWACSEVPPSTAAIPVTVDGSVPARVVSAVRSSGSASSPPRVTSSCCSVIWPRAPTARASASACVRTSAAAPRTLPVMAVSAVSSSGA